MKKAGAHMRKPVFFLVGVLLIAALLRIHNLEKESLWHDEGFSIVVAGQNVSGIIRHVVPDPNPPLYYLMLHYWMGLFGDSEVSVRFLSVVFGILTVWIMYELGALLFGAEVGIISSLIVALSFFHIIFSQDARMYTMFTFLALLSFYFFVRWIERGEHTIAYGVSSLLLLYTHIYGLFIILSQSAYLLLQYVLSNGKSNLKKWFLVQGILFLLFMPWVLHTLVGEVQQEHTWNEPISARGLSEEVFRNYEFDLSLGLVSLLSVVALFRCKTNQKSKVRMLAVWVVSSVALPIIISLLFLPIFNVKYLVGALLAVYVLAGYGVCCISSSKARIFVLCVIVAFSLVSVSGYYDATIKEQWRETSAYLDANAASDDVLVFHTGYAIRFVFNYYSKRPDLVKEPFPKKGLVIKPEDVSELPSLVKNHERVWVVLSQKPNPEPLMSYLSASYTETAHILYKGIEVYRFEKKQSLQS